MGRAKRTAPALRERMLGVLDPQLHVRAWIPTAVELDLCPVARFLVAEGEPDAPIHAAASVFGRCEREANQVICDSDKVSSCERGARRTSETNRTDRKSPGIRQASRSREGLSCTMRRAHLRGVAGVAPSGCSSSMRPQRLQADLVHRVLQRAVRKEEEAEEDALPCQHDEPRSGPSRDRSTRAHSRARGLASAIVLRK